MSKARKVGLGLLALLCALMLGFGLASCGSKDETPAYGYGEEGTYYYDDASGEEYLLTLRGGTYVLTYGTTGRSGSYSYDAGEDAFAFTSGGEDTFAAATADGALSVRYGGRTYLFLRYEYFTVTFTDGDETLSTQSVLNGKAATDPGAIEREGYVFYGWYQDAGFTKAFDFSSAVTADATAWGRYLPEGGDGEFIVTYDLTGETTGTVNGVVYDLPEPEMSGYVFLGWWVSATNSADELTYRYDGEQLYEDTTLFAVWAEEGASYLGASAYGDKVTWLASVGSTTEMTVYDAYGALLDTRTAQSSSGSLSYDFSSLPAGRYTVEVTSGGVTETLTYVVKGLYRVSGYEVLPGSLFTYSPVENAERYYISVDCATEGHDHSYIDNGTSLFFDFSDCEMGPDGITFTVIAYAEGYYYSSSSYTYFLGLDRASVRVEGDSVLWDRVPYAIEYEVYVDGTLVCVTEGTSFSLKGYGPGTLEIEVRPVTRGYWSERSETYTYDKTTLAAPEISGVEGYEVTWTPVEGAAGYTVRIGGVETTVEAGITSLYLSGDNYTEGLDSYEIAVKALAADSENDSPYGDAVVVTGADVGSAVSYENGTVTWQYSLSASEYRITVNDGDETVVTGTNSSPVTLTKSGNNEIRIYFVNDYNEIYGTASVTVYAYAIVFDARGGTAYMGGEPVDVIYVAKGDTVILPTAEYSGILADFVGWYTLPDTENTPDADGYLGDGYLYEDGTIFTGNSTIVLYACWINQRIKVSLNPAGGTLTDGDGNAIEYVEIPVGSSGYTISVPETDDKAYVFMGWYTGVDGTGMRYAYPDGSASATFRDETVTTLYAYWAQVLMFETVMYNGETVLSVYKGPQIDLVSEVTIPERYTYAGEEWTVTYMDPNGFQGCSSLKTLNIPDTVVYMNIVNNGYDSGNGAFASTALENVNVYATGEPSTTKEIIYYSEDGVLFRTNSATGQVELLYYPYGRTDETYSIPATVSNETEYELQGNTEVPVVRDVTALSTNVFRSHTELTYMVIPDTVKDLGTYTFYNCTGLVSVEIPDGLETVGAYTFYGCSSLKSFDMQDSVTELGQYAFYNCTSLESITLSNSLTAINDRTFYQCTSLRAIEIPYGVESIGAYAFYRCTSLLVADLPYGLKTMDTYAFQGCSSLLYIDIPDSVEEIGTYCFNQCTGAASVRISANLKAIPEYSFTGCTSLKSVYLPEGLETIGKQAFQNDNLITTITIPSTVTKIDEYAFRSCFKLVEVYNLSSLTISIGGTDNGYAGYYAKNVYTPDEGASRIVDVDGMQFIYDGDGDWFLFDYTGTDPALVLPDEMEGSTYEVTEYAFYGNETITSVVISEGVAAIGNYAFYRCYNLESIYLGTDLSDFTANNYVFYQAGREGAGIEVTIGSSVTRVPSYFLCPSSGRDYTPYVVRVVFEADSSCGSVGDYAFAYLGYLSEIELPGSLKTIGQYAFRECQSIEDIVIPDSVTDLGSYTFYSCTALMTVQLSSNITQVAGYTFYGCSALTGIAIPEGVTEIGTYGFYNCSLLKYVSLPSTLETIGNYAFNGCRSLTQIVLPEALSSIGTSAFNNCNKLVEVYNMSSFELTAGSTSNGYAAYYAINIYTPEEGETHLINIEGYWFIYDDDDEYYLIDYDGEDTELALAEDIYGNPYAVYQYAFYGNDSITSIVIPSTIKSVGNYAFYNCTAVEEIYFYAENMDDLKSSNYVFAYVGSETDGVTVYIGADVKEIPDYLFYPYSTASYAPNITSIVFEEGSMCESIGSNAFRGLTSLTSMTLPSSLKSIGEYAFYGCTSLSSVTMREGLEEIGQYAFYGCSALRSATVPSTVETIGNYAFYNCTSLTTLTLLNGIKSIGNYAFQNTGIRSLTLPSSVTYIGQCAFQNCSSLVNISILGKETMVGYDVFNGTGYYDDDKNWDKGVLYIGSYLICVDASLAKGDYSIRQGTIGIAGRAFYQCTALTGCTIPDSVTVLGEHMFYGCTALTSVNIPDSVTTIGQYCFYNCSSLSDVYLPESVTSIGNYCFYGCSSIRSMTIPDGITELPTYFFYNCSSLETVVLPEGLTSIGERDFYNCSSLREIHIPAGVTSIGTYAFGNCTSLTEVVVPEGVTQIASSLFYGCSSLSGVNIPDAVTSIGSSAFWECVSLKSITIPANVESIGTYAFYGCTYLEEIYYYATGVDGLTSSSYLFGRVGLYSDSLIVYIGKDVPNIPAYLFRGSATPCITDVVFEEGSVCSSIGDYAFYQCTELKEIKVPSTVTSIGDRAFYQCTSLSYIDIPAGVTYIGQYAFYECSSLDGVVLPDGLTSISAYSFHGCKALSGIVIPESVTEIEQYAFAYCESFTTITIPKNVETIGNSAFRYCYKLVEVCNLSSLTIVAGDTDNGYVGYYALHVYGEGESSSVENRDGYLFIADGDGNMFLIGYEGTGTALSLPEYVDGKEYEIYQRAFANNAYIVSAYVPATVKTMGEAAFYNCTALERVILDGGITVIPSDAFHLCSSLETIVMDGVTEIGTYAFQGCDSLETLVIPDSVTTLANYSLASCGSLKTLTIGTGVTSIGTRAIEGAYALEEVYFNATDMYNLSSSNYVFANAGQNGAGLTVTVGANVTHIPAYLFYPSSTASYAPNIVALVFEEGSVCTEIGNYCFYNAFQLKSVSLPEGLTTIGNYAFNSNYSLTTITIPSTVTSIGSSAFSYCYKLVEVCNLSSLGITAGSSSNGYVANYAKNVYTATEGESHMVYEGGLEFVYDSDGRYYLVGYGGTDGVLDLPGSVNGSTYEIITYAFYGRTDITTVRMEAGVTAIGTYAFYNCTGLKSLSIGSGVASIGNYAFYGCEYITELYFDAASMSNLSSGNYVFYKAGQSGTGIALTIGKDVVSVPNYLFDAYNNTSYTPYFASVTFEDGVLESVGNYAFAYNTSSVDIVFPDGLKTLGTYVFYNSSGIKSVYVPEGITELGSYVFYGCSSLETVYIPSTVESLGTYCFYGCSKLDNVRLPASLTTMGTYLFYNCSSLNNVVIPDGVTSIPNNCFYGCSSMTDIVIGAGVTSVGNSSFSNCTNLTNVYFNGTPNQWNVVSIGSSNTYLTNATMYYYSETEPSADGYNWWRWVDGEPVAWEKG